MKIKVFVDTQCHEWNIHHEPYTVYEDQEVYFELTELENDNEAPLLFIDDHQLSLEKYQDGSCFRSISDRVFRESFGFSTVSFYLAEQRFEFRFEVLVKKTTAQDIEEMIYYLMQKHNDIIQICFSKSHGATKTNEHGTSDPETVLKTVETYINTLMTCRLELQHHLHKRLVPIKQPAWKSPQGCDIDPFDIIFNLDVLEPVLGDGDVIVNGRSFRINEVEVTTLQSTANVAENSILLSGLYAMRRKMTHLLNAIHLGVPQSQSSSADSEYESLDNVLLRLTFSNIKTRCETQLIRLEEFIRYFEKTLGITYQGGDYHPVMTPFVRAVRVYRRLFEQLHQWYQLGEPSLEGRNFLIKLRSISKIYEFVTLFKLIDYLYARNWIVSSAKKSSSVEFIPESVTFEQEDVKLTLNYEPKINPYDSQTKHLDLVDMEHIDNKVYEFKYKCPDFVLKLEANNRVVYLILDAKYSSAWTIKTYSLPVLYDKYFIKMAVYNAESQLLKQDAILGVIALFHDKNAGLPIYIHNWEKYGIGKKPARLPIIAGFSLLPKADGVVYRALNQLFEIAMRQLKTDE